MSDIDTRLQDILGDDVTAKTDRVQVLIDQVVAEATAELEEELRVEHKRVGELTEELSSAIKGRELAVRSHIKATSFLRQNDSYLLSIAEHKNWIIRLLARFAKWPSPKDEYDRLKYETTTEAIAEMHSQDVKWGPGRRMANGTGPRHGFTDDLATMMKKLTDDGFKRNEGSWQLILQEEYFEAMAETNPKKLKVELIQVAAVCLAWIVSLKLEKFRRRQ